MYFEFAAKIQFSQKYGKAKGVSSAREETPLINS